MLIKVDVYEGNATDATTGPSRSSIYSCIGRTLSRHSNGSSSNNAKDKDGGAGGGTEEDDDGVLLTIGRKGRDLNIPHKSISRKHAQLRLVGYQSSSSSPPSKAASGSRGRKSSKTKKEQQQQQQEDDNSMVPIQGCMLPRTDEERAACEESSTLWMNQMAMCLVVEYQGQINRSVNIVQPRQPSPSEEEDTKDKNKEDADLGNDSDTDIETDVEDGDGHDSQQNRQSHLIPMSPSAATASSKTNGTDDHHFNRSMVPSPATLEFVSQNYPQTKPPAGEIDFISVDKEQPMILPLGRYPTTTKDHGRPQKDRRNEDKNDKGDDDPDHLRPFNLTVDPVSSRTVLLQVSTVSSSPSAMSQQQSQKSIQQQHQTIITIRIEWIPIRVVFSGVPEKTTILSDLYKIGAVEQPQVVADDNRHRRLVASVDDASNNVHDDHDHDDDHDRGDTNDGLISSTITPTTHLVTTTRSPVCKQLTAWALGLPFVTPNWLTDMITFVTKATSVDDWTTTLPFEAPTSLQTSNKYLPPPSKGDQFPDFLTKKRPSHDLFSNYVLLSQDPIQDRDTERLGNAAGMKIVRLYNYKTQKLKKQRIKDLLLSLSSSSLSGDVDDDDNNGVGKTVVVATSAVPTKLIDSSVAEEGQSITIMSRNEIPKCMHFGSVLGGSTKAKSDGTYGSSNKSTAKSTKSSNKNAINGDPNDDEEDHDDTADRMQCGFSQVPLLSGRDLDDLDEEKDDGHNDDGNDMKGKNDLSTVQEGDDDDENDDDVEMENTDEAPPDRLKKDGKVSSSAPATGNKLGRPDVLGWYSTAPKDDKVRLQLRQQASKEFAKRNGGYGLEDPIKNVSFIQVASSPSAKKPSSTNSDMQGSSGGHRNSQNSSRTNSNKRNVPDFRKFRKNYVPVPSVSDYIVLEDDTTTELSNRAMSVRDQMTEQQRLLEEEQRRADLLFGGEGLKRGSANTATGAGKRRRRQ